MKINENCGQKVSNSSWRELVRVVAQAINQVKPGLDCARRRAKGNLWPLYETTDTK
jgi:hypothetical protein